MLNKINSKNINLLSNNLIVVEEPIKTIEMEISYSNNRDTILIGQNGLLYFTTNYTDKKKYI